jgi:hypothetical protein
MMNTHYKKILAVTLSLAGTLCTAQVMAADYDDERTERRSSDDRQDEPRMSTRDQRSLERYLESNEQTAQRLYQDPELIRDREFVRDHASLDEWLDNHADAAEALRANPQKYLRSTRASHTSDDRKTPSISERELSSFESLLDNNPETARRLYENPDLMKDRQFARDNTALNGWMEDHPRAADAIQANPHKFLWRKREEGPADFLRQLLK